MITEFLVTAGEKSKRLDRFLVCREPKLSRSGLQRLIEDGRIRLNGRKVRPSQKIHPGDHITMDVPEPGPLVLQGEAIALDILYEDDDLLVINKPAGIVVHPAMGHWTGTLVNALLHHFKHSDTCLSTVGGRERPGIVHRLDKQTSGVMVVAKTDLAHSTLAAQFQRHTILRVYEAFVWKVPAFPQDRIRLDIGRDTKHRTTISSRTANPHTAITDYHVERNFGAEAAYVTLHPHTGRTHQLRVHLKSLGHPILGDLTYGGRGVGRVGEVEIPRVMLHARELGFHHPTTGIFQEHRAPFPSDMEEVYRKLVETTENPQSFPAKNLLRKS